MEIIVKYTFSIFLQDDVSSGNKLLLDAILSS